MKTFRAFLSHVSDTSETVEPAMTAYGQDPSPKKIKSAQFIFTSIGPFPDFKELFGKTVEIRIID